MDCKASAGLGEFSRGGRTRGDHHACDHDMGCQEKYTPCGILDEDTGQLYLNFGSSYKTSDFIVDTLSAWWANLDGILEQHWNGTQLVDVDTMLGWAKTMAWKGLHPIVELSRTVYRKGVKLTKAAMRAVEARLERNPLLPKWDILIRPAE